MNIIFLGIDLAKNIFALHGVDAVAHVSLRPRLMNGAPARVSHQGPQPYMLH